MHLTGVLEDDAREDNDLTLPNFGGYPAGIIRLRNQLQAMRIERLMKCNANAQS